MYGKDTIGVINVGATVLAHQVGAAYTDTRLDATSDEMAIIYFCAKDMTIDNIGLNITALTGSPTYLLSIQGVDVSGDPDGTIKGGGSPASVNAAVGGTGWSWVTLDNSIAVSKGDLISIVIEDGTSGTNPDASNYADFRSWNFQGNYNGPPYLNISTDTGSTWTPSASMLPFFGFRNSGTTTDVMGNPLLAVQDGTGLLTTAVGQIVAQSFILPTSLGRRVKVHGIDVTAMYATTNFEVGIWDDSTSATEIIKVACDDDVSAIVAGVASRLVFFAPTWLDTGKVYYSGIKHTETGGVTILYGNDAVDNDNLSAFAYYPDAKASKFASSTWTQSTGFQIMGLNLLVSDWDAPGYALMM